MKEQKTDSLTSSNGAQWETRVPRSEKDEDRAPKDPTELLSPEEPDLDPPIQSHTQHNNEQQNTDRDASADQSNASSSPKVRKSNPVRPALPRQTLIPRANIPSSSVQYLHLTNVNAVPVSADAASAFNSASSGPHDTAEKERLYHEHLQNHFFAANTANILHFHISDSDEDNDYNYESAQDDDDFTDNEPPELEDEDLPDVPHASHPQGHTESFPTSETEYLKQLSQAMSASLEDAASTATPLPTNDTSTVTTPQNPADLLTPLQKLEKQCAELQNQFEQSSKQLLEEEQKTKLALEQQENLKQKLDQMFLDMRLLELPMSFHETQGEGIKIFDNNCSDLLCCVITLLMRFKPVVRYFLSSQNLTKCIINVDYKHAEGSDGMTSDVVHNLVHQYWKPENAKFAIDTEIMRFLHRFYDRYYEEFLKWDAMTFLWYIIDNLQFENVALWRVFDLSWQSPQAQCRQCGHFATKRQKNRLSLRLRDRNMLIPVDVMILDLQSNQTTWFSFSREEMLRGVRWKHFLAEHYQLRHTGANLVLAITDVKFPLSQFNILSNQETLTRSHFEPVEPTLVFGWITKPVVPRIVTMPQHSYSTQPHTDDHQQSSKKLTQNGSPSTESTKQQNVVPSQLPSTLSHSTHSITGSLNRNHSHQSVSDKLPYMLVSLFSGNSRLFLPFIVQIGIDNNMLCFDENSLTRQIVCRLKQFAKRGQLDTFMDENSEEHRKLNFQFLDYFFSEMTFNEADDTEEDGKFTLFDSDPHSRRYFIKTADYELPTMQLITKDEKFFQYFDLQSIQAEEARKTVILHETYHRSRHDHCTVVDYEHDALRRYFHKTKCVKCNHHCSADSRLTFTHLPENLLIELKRFSEFKPKHSSQRHPIPSVNNVPVWISYGLDLAEFGTVPSDELALYELSAVICHSGHPFSGFWEVYARTENSKGVWWHNFQSYSCQPVEFFKAINPGIYVLSYERLSLPSPGQIIVSVCVENYFLGGIFVYCTLDQTLSQVKERVAEKLHAASLLQNYFFQFRGSNSFLRDDTNLQVLMEGMGSKAQRGNFDMLYVSLNQYLSSPLPAQSPQEQAVNPTAQETQASSEHERDSTADENKATNE